MGLDPPDRPRIAYVVGRFPAVTETFVIRELVAVDELDQVDIDLYSLRRGDVEVVQPVARPWAPKAHIANPLRAMGSTVACLARKPARSLSAIRAVFGDYWSSPIGLVKALVTFVLACELAESMRRRGVRHVHAHFAALPGLAAWVVAHLNGITFSMTPHAYDLFIDQRGLSRKLRDAAFVIAISDYNRRFIVEHGGRPEALRTIRYGLDIAAYRRPVRRMPASGPVRALFVSSFKAYKGHRYFVEALTRADPALDRITADLVGAGPLLGEIQELVERRGLGDRIRFLGSQPEDRVRDLLAQADLLVQPSIVDETGDTEGLPNTIIEAMASGVPVVSTRVAGVPEIVREGETGLLAEPADADSLADALRSALLDPDATARRAEAAQELVAAEYDIDRLGLEMSNLFVQAVQARPS
jgi:colanic acid/amylovoran biosynthesis glycosyltransferase